MMCEGLEQSNLSTDSEKKVMSNEEDVNAAGSSEKCSSLKPQICMLQVSLLDLAADNDLVGFRKVTQTSAARVDEPENWYCRIIGTNKMASEQRTATMIASLYGSLEVLGFILLQSPCPEVLVNQVSGSDRTTALHCAAAGGSSCAVEVVALLLENGACYDVKDALGRRPVDVLIVNPKTPEIKATLEGMLWNWKTLPRQLHDKSLPVGRCHSDSHLGLPAALLIPEDKSFDPTMQLFSSPDSSSPLFSPPSPSSPKSSDGLSSNLSHGNEKGREYLVDASLPDIKNIIYMTDEFRMFSFKVRPCSRAYSHDWTECPFVHPGENARRRDPRRYHYSCVPCPDFRKGACRSGDACEYAHGVFECWLHPAQYRTRLCKDGTDCARRVCFFAHTTEELRPLYLSLSSAVPSPRDSPLELRTMGSPPLPPLSPFSQCNASVNTPPLSPSSSALCSSYGGAWSQPGIPPLHLPGGLHVSRLRAALNARDVPVEVLNEGADFDGVTAEFSCISTGRPSSAVTGAGSGFGRMGKFANLGLNIPPTNLQDSFSAEYSSPMPAAHQKSFQEYLSLSPQLHSFENQAQSLLSPRSSQRLAQLQGPAINQSPLQPSVQKGFYNLGSLRPISTRRVDLDVLGSSSVPLSPDLGLHNKRASFSLRDGGSWSSRDLSGSISSPFCSDWGSPSGKPDWGVHGHDLGKFKKSASFASHGPTEPDVSWVQSLVKDGPGDTDELG